ncbi:hypothetical protein HMPREF9621_01427 [Cutibacterium modestum HL037PA2]|nr:hypothetical protein HMPREF9621_01427 [Cutibacterium modestum HL037PA2]
MPRSLYAVDNIPRFHHSSPWRQSWGSAKPVRTPRFKICG